MNIQHSAYMCFANAEANSRFWFVHAIIMSSIILLFWFYIINDSHSERSRKIWKTCDASSRIIQISNFRQLVLISCSHITVNNLWIRVVERKRGMSHIYSYSYSTLYWHKHKSRHNVNIHVYLYLYNNEQRSSVLKASWIFIYTYMIHIYDENIYTYNIYI